jgi:hypothetical protein
MPIRGVGRVTPAGLPTGLGNVGVTVMGLSIGSTFTTEDGGKVTILDITVVFAAGKPIVMIKYEWTFEISGISGISGTDCTQLNTFCEIYSIRSAS